MGSITIDDVARTAGVSIKTVSRVLNHEAHVRAETRRRVIDAMAALNFTPNISARALAGSKSFLIGLYIDNPSLSYTVGVQNGAMRACRRLGRHLMVEQVQESDAGIADRIADLHREVRVDGVILTPPICDRREALDTLDQLGVPYVRIAPTVDVERSSHVFMDDRGAAEEMTRYLAGLGHQRIAFIAGPPDHVAASRRRQGFIDAMGALGLAAPLTSIESGAFSFRSGWEAAERLLDQSPPPTSIFCANDDMALGVMALAQRRGLEIPRHLTITGFDDTPTAEVVWPRLTTVRQPVEEMAEVAVEFLVSPPKPEEGKTCRLMPFALIVRESAGPPGG